MLLTLPIEVLEHILDLIYDDAPLSSFDCFDASQSVFFYNGTLIKKRSRNLESITGYFRDLNIKYRKRPDSPFANPSNVSRQLMAAFSLSRSCFALHQHLPPKIKGLRYVLGVQITAFFALDERGLFTWPHKPCKIDTWNQHINFLNLRNSYLKT